MKAGQASHARARRRKAWRYGRLAEWACAAMLRLKGYRILARRLKTPVGEIDLVARRGGTIAFVEVKARAELATAAASISGAQRRRIVRAAAAFLQARPGLDRLDCRFDVMLVRPWHPPVHLSDAWRPD